MTGVESLDAVRRVLAARRADILRRYCAVGTGIGRPDPTGPYVITVYVTDPALVPGGEERVDGVALHFVPTGPFQAGPR
ncbi:hypothetical protein [Micromonospora sp. RTGN7]|uniref:hypothetical protein n=1 Tax=Micromonospora sp. RTGN7 TaxID=3016526 RepID=UPI0029FF337A|nr:hypothetical protein [Micromonospora sp. RTGN7]